MIPLLSMISIIVLSDINVVDRYFIKVKNWKKHCLRVQKFKMSRGGPYGLLSKRRLRLGRSRRENLTKTVVSTWPRCACVFSSTPRIMRKRLGVPHVRRISSAHARRAGDGKERIHHRPHERRKRAGDRPTQYCRTKFTTTRCSFDVRPNNERFGAISSLRSATNLT